MREYGSLKHTKRECKYHVVFIPKCRRKILYGQLRWELAQQKKSMIEEGHLMVDHVAYANLSSAETFGGAGMGYRKGKCAIHIARGVCGTQKQLRWGSAFGRWDTGVDSLPLDNHKCFADLTRGEAIPWQIFCNGMARRMMTAVYGGEKVIELWAGTE